MKKRSDIFNMLFADLTDGDIKSTELKSEVSSAIHAKRIELGMSQSEFAKFMNVSQAMVSKWESHSYNFSLENIADIFTKLKIDIDFSFKHEAEDYEISLQPDYIITVLPEFSKISDHESVERSA